MVDDVVTKEWTGTRVLVTGHTGFKGAWLSLWLAELGAAVTGLSDSVPTAPSLHDEARLGEVVDDRRVDIRDAAGVADIVADTRPQVVFHLAAQSLVRRSYAEPAQTWAVNVAGTVNVLEACRASADLEAVVVVTSDKCYENRGDGRHHREGDPLGGADPYSSSKAAAEIATAAWRASFFGDGPLTATVRAGNVIGGGDWSQDRLVPDFVRAATSGETLGIRNPHAVRPWQDVVDCLAGYLAVAGRLRAGDRTVARAWNFGPDAADAADVATVVTRLAELWPSPVSWDVDDGEAPREAALLLLDASAAREALGWRPQRTLDETLADLAAWYAAHADGADARKLAVELLQRRGLA